jgi:zinc and cadmium transporter
MNIWIYSIGSVIFVSLISLIGVLALLLLRQEKVNQLIHIFVSFAVGALLGGAILHLIPKSFNRIQNESLVSLLILVGVVVFFALEKFLHWRHSHHIEKFSERVQPFVVMNLVGDAAHNFIDGIVIAASYMVDPTLGFTTTIAVLFHEIPQEIGDFSVLIYGGLSPKKALLFNLLSALTAVLGAVFSLIIGSQVEGYSSYVLPITAGNFIYIAASDLIPELQRQKESDQGLWQLLTIILGVGLMIVPKVVRQIM